MTKDNDLTALIVHTLSRTIANEFSGVPNVKRDANRAAVTIVKMIEAGGLAIASTAAYNSNDTNELDTQSSLDALKQALAFTHNDRIELLDKVAELEAVIATIQKSIATVSNKSFKS